MSFVRKRKTGYAAYAVYYRNGKRKQKTAGKLFKLKKDAQRAAMELQLKVDSLDPSLSDISFADYYDKWRMTYKVPKITSHSGRYQYELIGKWIQRYFKDKKMQDIRPIEYQRFLNWYGDNHGYESARKLKGVIHTCVSYAVIDDVICKNFTDRAELTYNSNNSMKVEYLSTNELKNLVHSTVEGLNINNTSRYMILTAIYTGMRKSEIQALTWKDINFVSNTITVNKSWDERTKSFKKTKTKSSNRTIKVNSCLLRYLRALQANGSTMVFQNSRLTIPTSNALNKCLRRILSNSHISKRDFHFHSLRHVHVAYLLSKGIDIYAISRRLGHSNITITLKTYSYLIDEFRNRNDSQIVKCLDVI